MERTRPFLAMGLMMIACVLVFVAGISAQQEKVPLVVTVGVTANPIQPGEWTGVTALVVNQSTKRANFRITFTAETACNEHVAIGQGRYSVDAGHGLSISAAYPTSAEACAGEYLVKATVESGSTEVSGYASFLVE